MEKYQVPYENYQASQLSIVSIVTIADEDKKQHDLAVEKYQVPYENYQASQLSIVNSVPS